MPYDLYRSSSIYESSANAINLNPSLAEDGYYSKRPALVHEISENVFEIPDDRDVYSPNRVSNIPKNETSAPPVEVPYSERTHPGLAALVAKIIEQEEQQPLPIEKVIIAPPQVTETMGTSALRLLEAANSL